ncbi:MAG: 4Fe-4S dicluster domain-containing protein [Clostridia bacterium]
MAKMIVDENICKGCGLCVTVCPKKIIKLSEEKLNSKGYKPAEVIKMEDCIGCAMCGLICPDCAITVER